MAMYINFVTDPYAAPVTSMAMLFFYNGLTVKMDGIPLQTKTPRVLL
jgi:hypothetical protein